MTLKGSSGNVGIGTSDPTTYAGSNGGMVIYRAGGSSNAMLSCANTTGSGTMRQIDFFQGTSTGRIGAIRFFLASFSTVERHLSINMPSSCTFAEEASFELSSLPFDILLK